MKTFCILSCLAAAALWPAGQAAAQAARGASDQARYEARKLADEGQGLFDAGDYRGAVARLRDADARFPAPTIKTAWAEAHEKLGELLEARALYERIASEALDRDAPAEFREAQAGARAAIARLDKAIPKVAVELVGPRPPVLSLTLDRAAVSLSDDPVRVNPGKHTLSIEMTGQPVETRRIELKAGETRRIQIHWAGAEKGGSAAPPAPAPPPPPEGRSVAAPAIAFGVGGAGLVVGAIAGGVALSKMDEFRRRCGPELQCPASLAGELDGARVTGHVSTVGFAVAGAGAALGTLLLVLPSRRGGATGVRVGPGGVVVTGSF